MNRAKKIFAITLMMMVMMSMGFSSPGMFSISYADEDSVQEVLPDTAVGGVPAAGSDGTGGEAESAAPDVETGRPALKGAPLRTKKATHVSTPNQFAVAVYNAEENDEIIIDNDITFDNTTGWKDNLYIWAKTITIKSSGSEKYKLDLNNTFKALYVYGGSKCAFENVEITGSLEYGIRGEGADTEITLSDAVVKDNVGSGIYAKGIKSLTVTDSEISGCGSSAEAMGGGINSVGSDVYLSGSTVSNNKSGFAGGGINAENCTLTIENSTISSNESVWGGGIRFHRSTVTIKGTEISGNKATKTGGAMYANESAGVSIGKDTDSGKDTVISGNTAVNDAGGIMLNNCTGAEIGPGTGISENTAGKNGGGVNISGSSTLIIKGAAVSGNKASEMGGGIYLSGSGSAKLHETTVSGNEARTSGGGIAVGTGASFSMEMTDILNNKAKEWYGGGIYFNGKENGLDLRSGTLKGNYAYLNGGGIYMDNESVEEILDAVIYNNVADNQGGGLWACPAGHTSIYVNEGFAVFDNECRGDGEGHGTAGDDLVVQLHKEGESGNDEKALVSRRMLGGFENHYYYDGALTNVHDPRYRDVWEVDKTVPRYESTDKEPSVDEIYRTHLNKDDSIALKNVISDEAKKWAKENASLIITENHARLRGGGIATNGALSLGEKGVQLKTVSVRKEWDSEPSSHCEVELHQYDADGNNELLETVTLTADKGWKHTFTELPVTYVHKNQDGTLRHGSYTYKIREVKHAGWRATCTEEKDGVWLVKNHRVNEIGGKKTWDDDENSAGRRPKSITVRLHADGREIAHRTVTAANDWNYLFEDLKMYDEGKEIVYTVTEDAVHGYSAHIDEKSFDIRNEYTPGQTSVSVSKVWEDYHDRDGLRPASVKIQLMADGKACGKAVTLSEENKWVYTWDYLPEKKDGKAVVYTVKELTNAKGYTKKVSGDMEKGFTVTNTRTDEGTKADSAYTGDSSTVLPLGAALIASIAGMAFIRRRRRKENG